MILVDSSAWIDYFNNAGTTTADAVDRALKTEVVIIGDLILLEVLQGIRHENKVQSTADILLGQRSENLCGPDIAEQAAANYRALRRRGVTVRSTIDVIIATWCIVNCALILHNDRDMTMMEKRLGLQAYI